ncbi:MAG: CapA family protein [Eubacteriales bacterium]|nr:CapA family protein [Eubacteriales bacterium]
MKNRILLALFLTILICLNLGGCAKSQELLFPEGAELKRLREARNAAQQEADLSEAEPLETLIDPQAKPDLKKKVVNLAVVGDVLMHLPLIKGAEQADGSHDFAYSYRYVQDDIEAADYACFNMEGTLGGEPYEGYPIFSAPDSLAEQLKKIGFDMAYAANNHSLDRGVEGIKATARKLKAAGLDLVGTRESANDPKYLIKEVNGLKLGFINYSYETDKLDGMRALNGIPLPPEGEGLVDSFSLMRAPEDFFTQDMQAMGERVKEVKAQGVDFMVALIHWGDEYHTAPNQWQLELAQYLADQGVDLIVGAGPHVLQEVKWLQRQDGGRTLCYYSLGNFISNQQFDTGYSNGFAEDGLMALIQIEKNFRGEVLIKQAGYLATYCFKVHPANDVTFATLLPVEAALADISKYQLEGGEELLQSSLLRIREVMAKNSEGIKSFKSVAEFRADQSAPVESAVEAGEEVEQSAPTESNPAGEPAESTDPNGEESEQGSAPETTE